MNESPKRMARSKAPLYLAGNSSPAWEPEEVLRPTPSLMMHLKSTHFNHINAEFLASRRLPGILRIGWHFIAVLMLACPDHVGPRRRILLKCKTRYKHSFLCSCLA